MFIRSRKAPTGTALATAAALALAGCSGVQGGGKADASSGEKFPTKPIEWTAPSSAGGSTDLISRAVARAMEKPLGQSVVVVNKPGANGAVGGKEVLGRKADGYSLVMLFQSLMAIGPLTIDDPNAIKMSDMAVVSGLTVEDYVLVTAADSPYKSLADVLKKGDVKFGTTGAGTGSQLAQVLLFADAGVKADDVPFSGGAGALTAVLGKQVDVAAVQVAEGAPQLQAGKLRALATFSTERIEFLPDVPTAKESGHDIVVDQRRWLAAPKDLPDDVLKKLREAVQAAFKDAEYDKFLKTSYVGRWEVSDEEVVKQVEGAKQNYADLLKKFNVTLGGK